MSNRQLKAATFEVDVGPDESNSVHRDHGAPVSDTKRKRDATPQERMDEFNRQVTLLRPTIHRISQESRLLDKSAAMLIAGAAGLPMRGVVWIDCNMETEWFDKNDEKKLMAVAWNDVIGSDNTTIQGSLSLVRTDLGRNCPDDFVDKQRLKNIERVLKTFRKSQLSMQLFSLSPSTEAALSGIVMELLDRFESDFSVLEDTPEVMVDNRSSVFEHDDRTRRMCRMLRRLPFTRNEFCRVAGVVLRYNISLQDGVALSTRRLNQIQFDMRNAINNWTQFVERNMACILKELTEFWEDPHSFYIFDWSTHRLKILDSDQYDLVTTNHGGSVEEEVMQQEINGKRVCLVDEDVEEEANNASVVAAAGRSGGFGIGSADNPGGGGARGNSGMGIIPEVTVGGVHVGGGGSVYSTPFESGRNTKWGW